MLGLAKHFIEALEAKMAVDFGKLDPKSPLPSPLPQALLAARSRLQLQFSRCQDAVFPGQTRLSRALFDLPMSRMRIITAVVESLPYALRGIWTKSEEDPLVEVFFLLQSYTRQVTSTTTLPTVETEQLGHR